MEEVKQEQISEQEVPVEEAVVEAAQESVEEPAAVEVAEEALAEVVAEEAVVTEEETKPKNKSLKAAVAVVAVGVVALVALVGVYVFTLIQANGVINDAVELAQAEDYAAAAGTLEELSGGRYEKGLAKLQVVLDEQIAEANDDEDYVKVYELLAHTSWHPDYEKLSKKNNEALADGIVALMDEGDYAAAAKMLKKVAEHPDYDQMREMITAESWIWTCINNLKPVMKNPRSLQINSVEIYEPYNAGAKYPVVILCESGQNGFGGYATSYTVYDDKDLSLDGSTSSISDPDDLSEALVALLITGYRKTTPVNYEYDLNRINRLLSDGASVKPDLKTYTSTSNKNT